MDDDVGKVSSSVPVMVCILLKNDRKTNNIDDMT